MAFMTYEPWQKGIVSFLKRGKGYITLNIAGYNTVRHLLLQRGLLNLIKVRIKDDMRILVYDMDKVNRFVSYHPTMNIYTNKKRRFLDQQRYEPEIDYKSRLLRILKRIREIYETCFDNDGYRIVPKENKYFKLERSILSQLRKIHVAI